MSAERSVVIVGAGLAGARCAEALRAGGFDGRVVLVGQEPAEPYERPALSKEFLAGERSLGDMLLRPRGYWAGRGIELELGSRVERLDVAMRAACLANGRTLHGDALVLATGARPRRLAGGTLPRGVQTLRDLADALALRRALRPDARLAVVGAGLVGTEVASTASLLGARVTLIDPSPLPFARTLGPEVGELLRDRYRDHGVALRLGVAVAGFQALPGGAVEAVVLADGSLVRCDVALVGIGAEPARELFAAAGPGGIKTDAAGRTSVPGVYACGDVAATWRRSLGEHVRVEHWTSAARQGLAVARAILGNPDDAVEEPPYFWSDQFGLRLQYVGHAPSQAQVSVEGPVDSFRARYLDAGGRLRAVLVANRPAEIGDLRREVAALGVV